MERTGSPPLLPILRSKQQAAILAMLLGHPELELSLTEIGSRTGAPAPSVHREVDRAEAAGLLVSTKVGNTRLVRANTDSPYYAGLADVLDKAFGPPQVIGGALAGVDGIEAAFIYGSWAARYAGQPGQRPVGDVDLLVLGEPNRDVLYAAVSTIEPRLGRDVQITIRAVDWLATGSGTFHDTVTSRPLVEVPVRRYSNTTND